MVVVFVQYGCGFFFLEEEYHEAFEIGEILAAF